MNIESIKEAVRYIESEATEALDYESAHSLEDTLYCDFITHVSKVGSPELREMALECLKSQELKFPRYCA